MGKKNLRQEAKFVSRSLERIHRRLRFRVFNKLEQSKITLRQHTLLSVLSYEGSFTITDAASYLYVTKSAITAMVNKLVRMKMVSRVRSRRDRRVVEISVTDKGRVLVGRVMKEAEDFYIPILRSLGEKDKRELIRLQGKISQLIGNTNNIKAVGK